MERTKRRREKYFVEGNFCSSIISFELSKNELKTEYDDKLPTADISTLIALSKELAQLYTNISKIMYDLAMFMKSDLYHKFLSISLENAESSIKINPTWLKGFHRKIEVQKCYGEKVDELTSSTVAKIGNKMLRFSILNAKLPLLPIWSAVKYKDCAFLIDENGQGHFTSIDEVRAYKKAENMSLILNPGIHNLDQHITDLNVDIVGNCTPSICPTKNWLLCDLPVKISGYLIFENKSLSISRVSFFCTLSHAISVKNAKITLTHCSFKSTKFNPTFASVACMNSQMKMDGCYFTHTYAGLLAEKSRVEG